MCLSVSVIFPLSSYMMPLLRMCSSSQFSNFSKVSDGDIHSLFSLSPEGWIDRQMTWWVWMSSRDNVASPPLYTDKRKGEERAQQKEGYGRPKTGWGHVHCTYWPHMYQVTELAERSPLNTRSFWRYFMIAKIICCVQWLQWFCSNNRKTFYPRNLTFK